MGPFNIYAFVFFYKCIVYRGFNFIMTCAYHSGFQWRVYPGVTYIHFVVYDTLVQKRKWIQLARWNLLGHNIVHVRVRRVRMKVSLSSFVGTMLGISLALCKIAMNFQLKLISIALKYWIFWPCWVLWDSKAYLASRLHSKHWFEAHQILTFSM